jgi:glucose/arabinose dehydrogenase/PKD repeat protein
MRRIFGVILFLGYLTFPLWGQPDGFSDQLVSDGWLQPNGLTFDENGRMYVWEKAGKVWLVENGQKLADPLIDLSEEVGNWGDHGLLGFALHPDFLNNGYFYLLYAVDRHHLLHYGTSAYNPATTITEQASIARLTRYTADAATNMSRVVPNSRHILIGATASDGIPLVHRSHGVGSLVFATDGSLMVTCGDGASYDGTDTGGGTGHAFAPQALLDGILSPKEDIGSFRSQLVDNMNGKLLRIDPLTGAGIPNNPFFDVSAPYADRSRVWALGLRNPFRFSLIPGTGSHDLSDGQPGTFIVGDVGWAYWEELNVVNGPGQNFGWPIYEGMRKRWEYESQKIANLDAPNPLSGTAGCDWDHFPFQDLISDSHLNPNFGNPCFPNIQVPFEIPTFVHQKPSIAWSNSEWNHEEQNTFVSTFSAEGESEFYSLEDVSSPVQGPLFNGYCTIGGVYYTGGNFPEKYQESFFAADHSGWIRRFTFDENMEVDSIELFSAASENLTVLTQNPVDGCLYYIHYAYSGSSEVRRICYGANAPPRAVLDLDREFGPSPLTVQFSGVQSSDPEGENLQYRWDFGDGNFSSEMDPAHTFQSPDTLPTPFAVKLTVTDPEGVSRTATKIVSLNNTPPSVDITSLENGDEYTTTGTSELSLQAQVTDWEHGPEALSYAWYTTLHHNSHVHEEPPLHEAEGTTYIAGEGCDPVENFFYSIRLTVTDEAGLSSTDQVYLFPYCGSPIAEIQNLDAHVLDKQVLISWEAVNETPGASYEVQRSIDGQNFEGIGQLNASGEATYQLIDSQPFLGQNFYRILLVRADGFFEFSPVVSTRFPPHPDIMIYPNPTFGEINLDFRKVHETAEFSLYDLQGRAVVKKIWIDHREEVHKFLQVPLLSPGWYTYRISDGKSVVVGKLQKLR